MWPDENWSFDEAEAHGFDGSGRGLYEPSDFYYGNIWGHYGNDPEPQDILGPWEPQPMSVYLIGIIAFMVGFALCFLIFVP